ncbi:MAG: hypothetical protein FWF59_15230 [Turicibacter sp.]|nr:hypothetical protein [Turicibacter sp.]
MNRVIKILNGVMILLLILFLWHREMQVRLWLSLIIFVIATILFIIVLVKEGWKAYHISRYLLGLYTLFTLVEIDIPVLIPLGLVGVSYLLEWGLSKKRKGNPK